MKKRNAAPGFLAALCVLVLAAVWTPEARAMTGSGTEADPYVLTTPADLEKLHDRLDAHYALGADINMGGLTWKPVGDGLEGAFTGTLDGRGHTLSHLYLDMGGNKYTGLFGYLEGTVQGVKLDNVQITGGRYTGGIAGNAGVGSAITDCHVLTGAIKAAYPKIDCFMGGIVGLCEGNVTDCSNGARLSMEVSSRSIDASIGGIAGTCAFSPVEIKGCTNTGEIFQGSGHSISTVTSSSGGIIGSTSHPVVVEDCSNRGCIQAKIPSSWPAHTYWQGGIIGAAKDVVRITRCENRAEYVYGIYYHHPQYVDLGGSSGGIIGSLDASGESSIVQCATWGEIGYEGSKEIGAIICAVSGGGTVKIDSCENRSCYGSAVYAGSAYALMTDYKSMIINTGINISSATKILVPGETTKIPCDPAPSNATFLDSIVWTSDNETVATVDQNGVVTAHSFGRATITAATTGLGLKSNVTVQVAAPMSIDPPGLTLEVGFTAQLTPVRTPEVEDTYTWRSNDSYCVNVDSNGIITAKVAGSATITATSVNSGRTATCKVIVIKPVVQAQSVECSQKLLRPVPGERVQLSATVLPTGTTDKSVTWESSNPEAAEVSSTGLLEAIAPGEATITVRTANGLYDTCQVKVLQLSSAAFVIPDSRGSVNDTFDTAVHLVKNPGIAAFTLTVKYDTSALTPVAVTPCDLLDGGTLTSSLDGDDAPAADGALRVTWYSTEDAAEDGPAFTIQWQAGNETGTFPVSLQYNQQDICNAEKIEVTVAAEAGSVLILDRPVGDIYQDGLVNMKDIVCLARSFNGLETLDSSQQLAADLFYDGEVNVKDLTELAQILSGSMPDTSAASLLGLEAAPLTFTVSDVSVKKGADTVTAAVSGSGESSAALRFRVVPPEGMNVLSVRPAGVLAESGTFAYNGETGIVTWYGDKDLQLNGELFTVTLDGADSASLPARVELEYAEGDFFLAGTYEDVPVSVLGGTISTAPSPVIQEAAIDGAAQVRVSVENIDESSPALLIAAFYEGGRMTALVTENVVRSDAYLLDVPAGAAGHDACRVFLVDETGRTPLSPSQVALRS